MDTSGEDAGATTSENFDAEPLTGWSKEDKYHLYLGIKNHGSKAVKKIQDEYLSHKTLDEINEAIQHYIVIARKAIENKVTKAKKRKIKPKPSVPLACWAKLLTDSMSFDNLQTDIATALRIIADTEHMPSSLLTEQIDFKKIYHHLANTMEGKSLPDNRLISDVLSSCVLDTALVSKNFIKHYGGVLPNINLKQRELTGFRKPSEDPQTNIVREILPQKNYNPLNITEDSLTYPVYEAPAELESKTMSLNAKIPF